MMPCCLLRRQSKAPIDPLEAAKKKFVEGVGRQIALAKNPKYTIEKASYKGGKKQIKKAPPRQWWKTIDGVIFIPIRYGNKPLQLKGGSIATCQPKDLVKTLEEIKNTGEKGDWDDAILRSATRMSKAVKGGRAKKRAVKRPRKKATA